MLSYLLVYSEISYCRRLVKPSYQRCYRPQRIWLIDYRISDKLSDLLATISIIQVMYSLILFKVTC